MARARSPNRDKAFEMWRDSKGIMQLVEIAAQLGIKDSLVRKWKSQDKWEERLNGNAPFRNSNVTIKKGAPERNKNAVGNKGGAAPKGNANAVTHGFFRRIFPDDEETHNILNAINEQGPIDIIWNNIMIQYTAIARAQKVMFVSDQNDMTKELKKEKFSENSEEHEYEIQFAWDKQATFLNAQSRAIATLQKLIEQYESMCNTEEQELRIKKLKHEVAVLEKEVVGNEDDTIQDWKEALADVAKRRREMKERAQHE